ncbi:MAG: hypothetical protein QXN59_02360, partial [Candidatus Micrarchaeaceae archaeon]
VAGLGGKVYDSSESGINILALDGLEARQRIRELSSTLTRVYSLGYLQRLKLTQCLTYLYRKFDEIDRDPTINDLINEIYVFIRRSHSSAEKNRLYQIKDRLEELNSR